MDKSFCKFTYFWTSYSYHPRTDERTYKTKAVIHVSFFTYGFGWVPEDERLIALKSYISVDNIDSRNFEEGLGYFFEDPLTRWIVPYIGLEKRNGGNYSSAMMKKIEDKTMFPFLWDFADVYYRNSDKAHISPFVTNRTGLSGDLNGKQYHDYTFECLYNTNTQFALDSLTQFYQCAGEKTKNEWLWVRDPRRLR